LGLAVGGAGGEAERACGVEEVGGLCADTVDEVIAARRGLAVPDSCGFDKGILYRADLLADGAADDRFEAISPDKFTQGVVNQSLVIAAACAVHDGLKMLDDIIVEPNRDSGLAGSHRHYGPAPGLAEIVLSFHLVLLAYCDCSWRVALRAEIILTRPSGAV
jgi:hypothetical protein